MNLAPETITEALSDAVLAAMADAAAAEIMPRWRALTASEIRTKSADWDLVTDADVNAEIMLTAALRELIDIPVVGEEATAADASLLDIVGRPGACWVVDPVDGTRNFVDGKESFACMIALIDEGRTQAAWITYPTTGREIHAAAGVGAFLDGERFTAPTPPQPRCPARRHRRQVRSRARPRLRCSSAPRRSAPPPPSGSARAGTTSTSSPGVTDYMSFTRTLPWDHAPGSLIAREAGLDVAPPQRLRVPAWRRRQRHPHGAPERVATRRRRARADARGDLAAT